MDHRCAIVLFSCVLASEISEATFDEAIQETLQTDAAVCRLGGLYAAAAIDRSVRFSRHLTKWGRTGGLRFCCESIKLQSLSGQQKSVREMVF